MRKLPTAWSVIWTDNACYAMTSIGPVLFLMGLAVKLTGTVPGRRGQPDRPITPEAANLVLAGATVLAMIFAAIIAWRVARIRGLFDRGKEVEATVRKVSRFRGGTRLKLDYEKDGETHTVRMAFQRWSRTPAFAEGTRISLLVDPYHPKRAVPVALYASPGTPPDGSRASSASVEHQCASRPASEGHDLQLTSGPSRPTRGRDGR